MSGELTVDDLRAVVAELLETQAITDGEDLTLRGMDSLRMMRVLTRLRARGRGIRFSTMAQNPTVAGWWAASERLPAAAPAAGPSSILLGHEPFELTPVQYAYWAGRDERLTLGGVGAQYYVELDGAAVSPARMRSALHRLVQRHPMLRVAVGEDGRQRILPDGVAPSLRVYPDSSAADLEARRRALGQQRLDPATGRNVDAALSLVDGGRTRLHLTIDMMVADADSFRIMLNDLEAIYRGDPLPPLNYTFAAYVADVRDTAAAAAERARPYWLERLARMPRAPRLPTLPLHEATASQRRIHRRHLVLPADQTVRLEEKARDKGLSLSTVLLTAYAEVVGAYAEQDRFLLTLPFYLREQVHEDVGAVVGDFTNLLLLECDLSGSGFSTTAQRLQERLYADADNVAYSAVSVLRDLSRQWGEPALAPVVFTSAIGIGDLYSPRVRATFGEPVWTISQVPQTLLDCQVLEFDGGLLINWDCAEGLFAEGVLDGMFTAYRYLLEWLAGEDWTRPVPALVPADQLVVRGVLNGVASGVGGVGGGVGGGLLWSGLWGVDGGRVAVAGGWSFGELRARALAVVGFLRGVGVGSGARVGVCLPKGADQVAVAVGVSVAGCVFVPVSPDQPVGRRAAMCAAADVRWVCSVPGLVWPEGVVSFGVEEAFAASVGRPVEVSADETAYVIFTSGSTGVPKGVMVSHRQAVNTIVDVVERFDVTGADRVLAVSGLDFDLSVFDVFGVLGVGGALVLPSDEDRREAGVLLALAREHGVTVWNSVPALVEMVCVVGGRGALPGLRLVMVSGDWVRPDLVGRVRSLAPGARFVALGGATEAAIWSNFFEVTGALPGWSSVPYGWPLAGQAFRVVDVRGRDCPDWVVGELWIGGAGVAQGYAGDPELTAAKFVVGSDGGRWYRTGDMGRYRPGGVLEILGRRDGQVKLRGHRIETGEIEAALVRCEGVRQAVVVLAAPSGTVSASLVAYVVGEVVEEDVPGQLADLLPGYMIPRRVVRLAELPLTVNGKVDRGALARRWLGDEQVSDEEPRGELEKLIAATWADVLGVAAVGRGHNFFTLGGDSLTATRLIARLAAEGLPPVSLRALFDNPTVAGLATQVTGPVPVRARLHQAPDDRYLPFPLTEVQRAYQVGRADAFVLGGIGSQSYWEFDAPGLDVAALERALAAVVARHDMLRAVCTGTAEQVVLREVPPGHVEIFADHDKLRAQLRDVDLDAAVWPPFALGYADGHLGVVLNHVTFDARSAMIFFMELSRLVVDPSADLPPLGLSFRDYVVGFDIPAGEVAAARAYWRETVAVAPDPPRLPLARDLATVQRPRFERRELFLDRQSWQRLAETAREHGLSPSSMLAAVYAETVSRWSEGQDLLLVATTFDRPPVHPDIDGVIGDFTNLTLVAYRPAGRTFWEAAADLQGNLWAGMDNRALSGIEVLRELAARDGRPFVPVPVVFTSALGMPDAHQPLDGPLGRYVHGLSRTPQTLLDCQVLEFDGGVLVNWDCVTEAFPPGVLDDMFAGFQLLLADPHATVVPADQLVVRGVLNGVASGVGGVGGGGVGGGLLWSGLWGVDGGRVAVAGGWSFGELRARALAVVGFLRGVGVGSGARVGVCLPKGADQVAVAVGVSVAGCVFVPVSPDQPVGRRAAMCAAADVRWVCSVPGLVWPEGVVSFGVEEAFAASVGRPVEVSADETAYVIFTSGSTGVPKGVMVSHRQAVNTIVDVVERFDVTGADRVLAVSGLDFDLSVFDVFGVLGVGGALVLPSDEDRREAGVLLALAREHGVTVWNSVPALVEMVCVVGGRGALPGLRLVMVSGDWVRPDLVGRVRSLAPGARFVALGGATEAAIWSNFFEVTGALPGWSSVPYGWPLAGQAFRVVDVRGRDCPDWVVGELWIGGAGVAQGYAGDPELTAAKFVVGSDGGRWYRTGDMGRYRPGGVLEILGRRDGQVKLRGHRIETGEIEAALVRCEGVRQAVVVLAAPSGTVSASLVAYVVGEVVEEDVPGQLADLLPGYMIPRRVVRLAELPLTVNGKVDRGALARRWLGDEQVSDEEPRGELEKLIAATWADVLGVAAVGRGHNFFTLGGDSLTATSIAAAIRRHTGIDVTLRQVYETATVAALAELVAAARGGGLPMEEGVL
ncbi:amino acid adenylation domain-containing protein [Plantactinospora sp. WMMC1484]|uniref:amino acid adenylation domain-containing protein n=1 Tax=Plantactinospora sp. WMMC1484 TaxID=3404122 RepID=UPI003BF4B440